MVWFLVSSAIFFLTHSHQALPTLDLPLCFPFTPFFIWITPSQPPCPFLWRTSLAVLILNSSHLFLSYNSYLFCSSTCLKHTPIYQVFCIYTSATYLSLREQKPCLVSTSIYRTSIMASRPWLAVIKWVGIWVNGRPDGLIGRWMGFLPKQPLECNNEAGIFKVLGM